MNAVTADPTRRFWRKMGLSGLAGGITGGAAVFLLADVIEELPEGLHVIGAVIAVLLAWVGLALLWASASPERAARTWGTTMEPGEDFTDEIRSLRAQAVVTLLAGAELLLLSWPIDALQGSARPALLAALVIGTGVQNWLNWRLWRSGDEFFRRVLVEACVLGFVLSQLLVFFWAVGERFGYVAAPGALDIYVLMMGVYLVASSAAGVRRGIGVPG